MKVGGMGDGGGQVKGLGLNVFLGLDFTDLGHRFRA
jgi:hypothetical protein